MNLPSTCHLHDMAKPDQIGSLAAKKTIQKLNPQKIESEKISIIFDRRISKGILSSLASCNICSINCKRYFIFKR